MYIAFQSGECWTTLLYMYVHNHAESDSQQRTAVETNCGQLKLNGHTEWFLQTKCSWRWYMYLQCAKISSSAVSKYCSLVS